MPPRAGSPQRQGASKARVVAVAVDTTVKATPGVLHRLVISNSAAAATLTVKDGATAQIVLNVPANTAAPVSLDIDCPFTTSIVLTPSNASVDVLAIFS